MFSIPPLGYKPPQFTIYRILACTAGGLEPQREIFEATVAKVNESVTMPDGVLFAPASFRSGSTVVRFKNAVEANVRMCEFSIHIFGESAPATDYVDLVKLAMDCVADDAKPARATAVFFLDSSKGDQALAELRARLSNDSRCEVYDYTDDTGLASSIKDVMTTWYQLLRPQSTSAEMNP